VTVIPIPAASNVHPQWHSSADSFNVRQEWHIL